MAKLSGPAGASMRVVLHPSRLEAIVSGIFPPERASQLRSIAQSAADRAAPKALAAYERSRTEWFNEMLHGNGMAEPKWLLHGYERR